MTRTEVEYYSSVNEEEIQWLWYPYIPFGKITLFQGDPGDGKSMFMLNLIASITNGTPLPDGSKLKECYTVIYQCSEDGIADTIKPRLLSANADCDKVAFISEEGKALTIEDERIEKALQETGARMLIFDPIQAYIPSENDMQNAVRMRSLMKKLSKLAENYNCAVVLIGHMTKANGNKHLYRGLGSIDLAAIARSVLMIEKDKKNPALRYVFQIKSNLASEGSAICFAIDKKMGFLIIGPCEYPTKEDPKAKKKKKSEEAEDLLRMLLSTDCMATKSILEHIEESGISERTVRSAAKKIGVKAFRKSNVWYWTLKKE